MDGSHITNVMEEDFENILLDAAGTCRNIVSSEGEKAGLSLYTFDPVAVIHGGRLPLGEGEATVL